MSWKLIFALSLFGLVNALISLSLLPEGKDMFYWLPVFIICAALIARYAPGKYFLHGLMVGIVNCVWITGAHVIWADTYTAHHPMETANYASMNEKMHITAQQAMLIVGPVIGIISGIVLGLFAVVAGLLMKKKAAA